MLRIAPLVSVIIAVCCSYMRVAIAFSSSASHSFVRGDPFVYQPQRQTTATSVILSNVYQRSNVHQLSVSPSSSNGSNGSDKAPLSSDAQYFKDQAEKLRDEIAALEREKRTAQEIEAQKQQDEDQAAAEFRDRYSVVVPILKPDGSTVWESYRFAPIHPVGTSKIGAVESALPLGIIIGEAVTKIEETSKIRPYIVIDEVSADSFGAQSGLQVGDIVHACTACKMDMEMPTWQLLLGGIGRPKTNRYMHSVGTSVSGTNLLLESTMEAIASNRMDPEQRPILLVYERRDDPQLLVSD
jgi:hypothetical protein